MPMYDVWMEGYRATGEQIAAQYLGSVDRPTFTEACDAIMQVKRSEEKWEVNKYYDRSKLTYWGCRLFETEAAARKSFG